MTWTLTRKPQQRIIIDDPNTDYVVTLIVTEIRRGQVRLSIDAPRDVTVDREEVYLAERQNEEDEFFVDESWPEAAAQDDR